METRWKCYTCFGSFYVFFVVVVTTSLKNRRISLYVHVLLKHGKKKKNVVSEDSHEFILKLQKQPRGTFWCTSWNHITLETMYISSLITIHSFGQRLTRVAQAASPKSKSVPKILESTKVTLWGCTAERQDHPLRSSPGWKTEDRSLHRWDLLLSQRLNDDF